MSNHKTRIAVLGGTGFIGFHVTQRLVQSQDLDITLVDNLSRGKLDSEVQQLLSDHPHVRFTEADLTDRAAFQELGSGFDQVYLLAGIVGVRLAQEAPDRVAFTNSMIVLNALEWLKEAPAAKVVYASTSEAYSGAIGLNGQFPIPTTEDVVVAIDDVRNPRSTYAASKILGECAVMAYRQVYGIRGVVVRYHNVYGPRMGYEHVIPELSVRLLRGNDPCDVYGWDQTRAFCHVDDAVEATIAAMAADAATGEIIHIGTDVETPIHDLAESLCRVAGVSPKMKQLPAPPGSVERRCPDISKARELLGYAPKIALEDGLRRTFEWYRKAFESDTGEPR